jgi:hypothetical protein
MGRAGQDEVIEPERDHGKRSARRQHRTRERCGILSEKIAGTGPVSNRLAEGHQKPLLLAFTACGVGKNWEQGAEFAGGHAQCALRRTSSLSREARVGTYFLSVRMYATRLLMSSALTVFS